MDKRLTLPEDAIERLGVLAKRERMSVKPYMERVLIRHSDKANIQQDKV